MIRGGDFCAFGAMALRDRLQTLTREFGRIDEARDVECVHRMRVASRRLRSALALFRECIPDSRYRAWRKGTRSITQALGEARDLDVQIAFLEGYLDNLEPGRLAKGPERLLLRLRQKSEKIRGPVLEAVKDFAGSEVVTSMARHLRDERSGSTSLESCRQAFGLLDRSREAISSRVADVLEFEAYVDRPEDKEELHAMRIANKRLRYVMEIFAPLYRRGLKEELETIRELHTRLGEIHDCDVWEEFLPSFLEEEHRRILEFFGHCGSFPGIEAGIMALSKHRRVFRQGQYEAFRAFFHRTRENGFWERLSQGMEIRDEWGGGRS